MDKLVVDLVFVWVIHTNMLAPMGNNYILPTLFWDPKHPIFKCDIPTLRVRYEDSINIFCPKKNVNKKSLGGSDSLLITENMFYVKDKYSFTTCNATGGIQLLRCDQMSARISCHNSIKCPIFYNMLFRKASSHNEVDFKRGGTYYFIGTGFRTPDKVDNLIGGSCSRISNNNENKLRLQIYVCTDEEIKKGGCQPPNTETSYYKGCQVTCGNWTQKANKTFQNSNNECYITEARECTSTLIGSVQTQVRDKKIQCPQESCSAWKSGNDSKQYYVSGTCLQEESRSCMNVITGLSKIERKNVQVKCLPMVCSEWLNEPEKVYKNKDGICLLPQARNCHQPWIKIKTKQCKEQQIACHNATIALIGTAKEQNSMVHVVISLSLSLISLVLGLVCGTLLQIFHNKKKTKQQQSEIPTTLVVSSPGNDENGIIIGTLQRRNGRVYLVNEGDTQTVTTDMSSTNSESKIPRLSRTSSQTEDDDVFFNTTRNSPLPRAIQKQQRRIATRQQSSTSVPLARNLSDASSHQRHLTRTAENSPNTMTRSFKSASNLEYVNHI